MSENFTLREVIRKGLGDKWTKDLEDELFWSISNFVINASDLAREDALKKVRESMGIEI